MKLTLCTATTGIFLHTLYQLGLCKTGGYRNGLQWLEHYDWDDYMNNSAPE